MAREHAEGWLAPELLEAIYESAFDRPAYERLGATIARATSSSNCVLFLREADAVRDLTATTTPEALAAYASYYWRLDIWTPTVLAAPPMTVVASNAVLSDAVVSRSEFYTDFARPLDMDHPIGIRGPVGAGTSMALGLNRARSHSGYDVADLRAFGHLARHVQRALQLRGRLAASERREAAGSAALDALAFGAVVTDGQSRIRFANAAAEELGRRAAGIHLERGFLRAALADDAARLLRLVANAAAGGAGGATMARRTDGGPPLTCIVAPLPNRLSQTGAGDGLALVALRAAGGTPLHLEGMLFGLFRLSAAEAQICMALLGGHSPEEIARDRDVRITTLRTQLESIFNKTGATGQRELLRLLGGLPQVLARRQE